MTDGRKTVNRTLPRRSGGVVEGYSILARIGKGGMGAVFKAVHLETGRLVALKILPVNLARNRNYIRRFLREARSASQLSHPNVTRVYEVGNSRGIFYFSMEYVSGETLIVRIKRGGPMDAEEALDVAAQAAVGLAHAHGKGIVHRDVKPENIILREDGVVKLTDMGLAKKVDSVEQDITVTGQVVGTPCYMAPEQITSPKHVDHRVDIYGLGATLYHMVTGRRPLVAETSAQVMLRVLNEELLFLPDDDVPEAMQWLVRRMTAKSPAQRQQSMEEVLRDMDAVRRHLRGERSLPLKRLVSRMRRKTSEGGGVRAASALALFVVVALTVAVLFFGVLRGGGRERAERPAQEYFDEGVARAEAGDWCSALDLFNHALRVDPSLAGAWNNKGTSLFRLGRYRDALAAYEQALRLEPGNAHTHRNRGSALLALGRWREAADAFRAALRVDPKLDGARRGLEHSIRMLEEERR